MALLELFDFQQAAANALFESALSYAESGGDIIAGRRVPYVGQLKAVTGAGKTPILATVVGRLPHAIVLWTTKYGSVVEQTVKNLRMGGKYHHLLGKGPVEVLNFSEIASKGEWESILEATTGLTILVSTVASWNSSEKDERLNVHRPHQDWGRVSRWDQLKGRRRRPLWVVYDEAHNTTGDQVELLDDLDPAGFFLASASPLKGRLLQYVSTLPDNVRKSRIIPVRTKAVVEAQLLKSTIALADYDSSAEEMIADAVERRASLADSLRSLRVQITPKSIYVVESSNVYGTNTEPRPTAIWKTLVNRCGVSPSSIAICTNTKDLPRDAVRVASVNELNDQFTHIIFNKRLQEGWDDPAVYVCYFDGKTESATRIQQVIGRALRQPGARHLSDEELNTAFFFVNCPNTLLEKITDDLREELRIYKDDGEGDDFEPFEIKEVRRTPPSVALKSEWVGLLRAPRLQLELPSSDRLTDLIDRKTYDFGENDRRAPGKALVNVVSVRTGEVQQTVRDLLEDMRVPCGVYLQEQIRSLSKSCVNSLHPDLFTKSPILAKTACYRSKALEHYRQLALEVVRDYENHVQLQRFADPAEADFVVEAYQPMSNSLREFESAGHRYYDSKALRPEELDVAKALDRFRDYVWVRNRERVGYGIPLPIRGESSSTFYPDFLWWVRNTVWAIDPTGRFILEEKLRTKLFEVPAPLRIALVVRGKYDRSYRLEGEDGWTAVRRRLGHHEPEKFDDLGQLLQALVDES